MLRLLRAARQSLALVALGLLALFVLAGFVASRAAEAVRGAEERARALHEHHRFHEAEAVYLSIAARGPLPFALLVEILENHADLARSSGGASSLEAEEEIFSLYYGPEVPESTTLLAAFWYKVALRVPADAERAAVEEAAAAEPPLPWANRLLGREAAADDRRADAAAYFEREGLAFPEHAADLDLALHLYAESGQWDEVAARLEDPRYAAAASDGVRYHLAIHQRDWLAVARWFFPYQYAGVTLGLFALASISALGWFVFCARVGLVRERPRVRVPLYLTAFLLGIVSVYPTLLASLVEEEALKFTESANGLRNLIYCVLGIGLREELCKVLLFLPLLPFVRKLGKREALACGALVGLGFAAEENVGYFLKSPILSVAYTRFLTANFLHISTTALVAGALWEVARPIDGANPRMVSAKRDAAIRGLSTAFLIAIGIHGIYDYVLTNTDSGGLLVHLHARLGGAGVALPRSRPAAQGQRRERRAPLALRAGGHRHPRRKLRLRLAARRPRHGLEGDGARRGRPLHPRLPLRARARGDVSATCRSPRRGARAKRRRAPSSLRRGWRSRNSGAARPRGSR